MCERDTQLFYFMCSDYYCQITYFKGYDKSTCSYVSVLQHSLTSFVSYKMMYWNKRKYTIYIWYSFLTLYYITESYYKNYLGIVETNFFRLNFNF